MKQTGNFNNGKFDGPWRFYSEIGDLQKEEEYSNGHRNGLSIEYDDEGEKILEGMYQDDQRQGYWEIRIGDIVSKGKYSYGEKNGVWESTYKSGGKAFKGDYVGGKENGTHVYYYQNGQIEHNEQWKSGKAVKNWNYYNEKGNLKYSIYYKDGKENRIVAPSK